jgi:hypothetical protein
MGMMPTIKISKEDAKWLSEKMKLIAEDWNFYETPKKKKWMSLADRFERSCESIKPRSAKNKGASWQKEVAEEISLITEVPFDNQDDQSEILCRTMGCSGSDVILRGKALERFPIAPECKNQNNISISDWCKQAKDNEINGKWMLFIKSALLEEPIVAFPMRLLREYFKKEFGRW